MARRRPRGLPDAAGGDYAGAFTDATNAQAAMAREDFQQDQGRALGGLQAIGALRSGRANVVLNDLSRTFGRQVGNIAAGQAGQLASLDANMMAADADRAENTRQFDTGLDFSRERAGRSDFESDRSFGDSRARFDQEFGYRAGRDQVGDARDDRNFGYQQGRDTRADMVDDRNFGDSRSRFDQTFAYGQTRDARADMVDDRNFGDSRQRFDQTFGYQQQRDARGDMVTDRQFGEDTRRYDQGFGYQRERDARTDSNTDRAFGEGQRQFNVGARQFDLTRDDARSAARAQGNASLWGAALGGVAQLGSSFLANRGGASNMGRGMASAGGSSAADKIGRIGGAAGGAFAGAKTGAMLGSFIPGFGTVAGGVLGGAIGGLRNLFGRNRG
jgi:hypothetical protein